MPSVGIYSYELFKFYDVENIIRIGSAGSYRDWLKVMDVTLAKTAVSESSFAKTQGGCDAKAIAPSAEINDLIMKKAEELNTQERIMACVDIYQALTESRPYKKGMSYKKACEILEDMAGKGWLDTEITVQVDACFGSMENRNSKEEN